MNVSITEKLISIILPNLIKNIELSKADFLKCKLGLEIFIINATKLTTIYLCAGMLGVFIPTLIYHSAFMIIRIFAYGAHSKSSFICTLYSMIFIVGTPVILKFILFPRLLLIMINLVNFLLLIKYAPGKTSKNYLGNLQHQKKLKKRALIGNNAILLLLLILPNIGICNLLSLGSLLGGIFVTPCVNTLITSKKWKEEKK